MKIEKDPKIAILNDILSRISTKRTMAMKDGDQDALDAYDDVYRFILDMYCKEVAEWQRWHPISTLIMNIRHKRRLKRFREMTEEIRGTWV